MFRQKWFKGKIIKYIKLFLYFVYNFISGHGRESSHYHQAAVLEVGAMMLQNMFS